MYICTDEITTISYDGQTHPLFYRGAPHKQRCNWQITDVVWSWASRKRSWTLRRTDWLSAATWLRLHVPLILLTDYWFLAALLLHLTLPSWTNRQYIHPKYCVEFYRTTRPYITTVHKSVILYYFITSHTELNIPVLYIVAGRRKTGTTRTNYS
jgi:hypothetical protein